MTIDHQGPLDECQRTALFLVEVCRLGGKLDEIGVHGIVRGSTVHHGLKSLRLQQYEYVGAVGVLCEVLL